MLYEGILRFVCTSAILLVVGGVEGQGVEPRIVGGYNVTSMNGFKHQVSIRLASGDRTFGAGKYR